MAPFRYIFFFKCVVSLIHVYASHHHSVGPIAICNLIHVLLPYDFSPYCRRTHPYYNI